MMVDLTQLLFTSQEKAENEVRGMFKNLGLKIRLEHKDYGILQWRIKSKISLGDLCNIFNEFGYKGISITASEKIGHL